MKSLSRVLKVVLPGWVYGKMKACFLYGRFMRDFVKFKALLRRSERRFPLISWVERSPQLYDRTDKTNFDPHYLYHPAWAARVLARTKPKEHIDIASDIKFATIVSAFVQVRFYDLRPADIDLDGFVSKKGDITKLHFQDNSVCSLSCMHVIEHVGLGRYGDPLDPDGDLKAFSELKRVMADGGNLLVVLPVGRPRIAYNAHRIYSFEHITGLFSDFHLEEFALVPDDFASKGLIMSASRELVNKQSYGCGCFWFRKFTKGKKTFSTRSTTVT